jgi:hypothetical protein
MAAARFQRLVQAFDSKPVIKAATEFSKVSGRHTAAALVLKSTFSGLAKLQAETTGRHAELLWAAIDVGPTPLRSTETHHLSPGEEQSGALVNFLVAGWPGAKLVRSLWSCIVTDRALGRAIQRAPGADLDALIYELHSRVLLIPERNIPAILKETQLFIPSGPGTFAVTVSAVLAESKRALVIARALSWLPYEAIEDERLKRSAELLLLEPDDRVLASTVLHPKYLHLAVKSPIAA